MRIRGLWMFCVGAPMAVAACEVGEGLPDAGRTFSTCEAPLAGDRDPGASPAIAEGEPIATARIEDGPPRPCVGPAEPALGATCTVSELRGPDRTSWESTELPACTENGARPCFRWFADEQCRVPHGGTGPRFAEVEYDLAPETLTKIVIDCAQCPEER